MSHAVAVPKMDQTIRAHAITREGRHVLVVAEGPGVSLLERKIAAWNSRRWNEGKRTWLL